MKMPGPQALVGGTGTVLEAASWWRPRSTKSWADELTRLAALVVEGENDGDYRRERGARVSSRGWLVRPSLHVSSGVPIHRKQATPHS
jgi:hypothetical protein